MEKMLALISLYRSLYSRSYRIVAVDHQLLHYYSANRTLFNLSAPPTSSTSRYSLASSGTFSSSTRFYSEDASHLPVITDPELHRAFKDLLATSWNELPNVVISDVKAALSKNTHDKAGKEVVANFFHAAEAVVEFGDMVMNLKMELDDIVGMSGELRMHRKRTRTRLKSLLMLLERRFSGIRTYGIFLKCN
ncbi:hypothetical protein UlMin_023588, partial [Ulmus minor]